MSQEVHLPLVALKFHIGMLIGVLAISLLIQFPISAIGRQPKYLGPLDPTQV